MKKKLSVYNCYVYDDLENEREKKKQKRCLFGTETSTQ